MLMEHQEMKFRLVDRLQRTSDLIDAAVILARNLAMNGPDNRKTMAGLEAVIATLETTMEGAVVECEALPLPEGYRADDPRAEPFQDSEEDVQARLARFCAWFDVPPPFPLPYVGKIEIDTNLADWVNRHGVSWDWLMHGGTQAMAAAFRRERSAAKL